jgi:hypothetical protein
MPDLNLLIYAHNAADPRHVAARRWWEACLNGDEPVGLAWATALGFVRLTTHRQALVQPLAVEEATVLVEGWFDQPVVRVLVQGGTTPGTALASCAGWEWRVISPPMPTSRLWPWSTRPNCRAPTRISPAFPVYGGGVRSSPAGGAEAALPAGPRAPWTSVRGAW